MKKFILLFFIVLKGAVFASSLYSPYPTVSAVNIEVVKLKNLYKNDRIQLNYYLSGIGRFSSYPLIAVPNLKVDTGVHFYYQFNNCNFNLNASSGIGILINPFVYRDKYYDMDYLIMNTNRVSLGYRFFPTDKLILEPYLGGDFDLFASTMHYYGVMPWISVNIGLKIIL